MKMIACPLCSAPRRCLTALLAGLIGLSSLTGCIRSRVILTSEPSGAEVIWRGQPYGATPVTIPFIWYWYYDIALEKPGYKRLEATERFRTPPWFLMPLDVFMEIIPVPIPDTRERHYVLQPSGEVEKPLTAPEMVITPEMFKAIEKQPKAPSNQQPGAPAQPAPAQPPAPAASTPPPAATPAPAGPAPAATPAPAVPAPAGPEEQLPLPPPPNPQGAQ